MNRAACPHLVWLLAAFVFVQAWPAAAQNRPIDRAAREADIRRAEQRLREAEKQLSAAKKKVGELKSDASKVMEPYRKAMKLYEQAKVDLHQASETETATVKAIRENHPINKKIEAARTAAAEIGERRTRLREKILAGLLQSNPEYKKLKTQHEGLKKTLSTAVTPRPDLSKQMLAIGSRVGKLEAEALTADGDYQALLKEARKNHAQMATFQKDLAGAIGQDPKRTAAAAAVDAARAAHKQKLLALNKTEIAKSRARAAYDQAYRAQRSAEKVVKARRFQLAAARAG